MRGALPSHIFAVDQRRAARDVVSAAVTLRRAGPPYGLPVAARLLNISRSGFMASSALRVVDGARIAVELPLLGNVPARAVWSMEDRLGGAFLEVIEIDLYYRMLERLEPASA